MFCVLKRIASVASKTFIRICSINYLVNKKLCFLIWRRPNAQAREDMVLISKISESSDGSAYNPAK